MASETIKAVMMITLFGVLEALLHQPQSVNLQTVNRWLLLHPPHWPTHAPVSYVLIPVRARHGRR